VLLLLVVLLLPLALTAPLPAQAFGAEPRNLLAQVKNT